MRFYTRRSVHDALFAPIDEFRKKLDRHVTPRADVDGLAFPSVLRPSSKNICIHNILHMRIIARDRAVTEDRERSSLFFRKEKRADRKRVRSCRIEFRAVDVEIAQTYRF